MLLLDLFGDRNSEGVTTLRNGGAGTAPSPEKEDRYYSTRGSTAAVVDENGHEERGGSFVLPKLLIALSSKEKEEDFMAMKGCKLPQRPKKRAKMIQRSLLVSNNNHHKMWFLYKWPISRGCEWPKNQMKTNIFWRTMALLL